MYAEKIQFFQFKNPVSLSVNGGHVTIKDKEGKVIFARTSETTEWWDEKHLTLVRATDVLTAAVTAIVEGEK